jgi:hypothetical protein
LAIAVIEASASDRLLRLASAVQTDESGLAVAILGTRPARRLRIAANDVQTDLILRTVGVSGAIHRDDRFRASAAFAEQPGLAIAVIEAPASDRLLRLASAVQTNESGLTVAILGTSASRRLRISTSIMVADLRRRTIVVLNTAVVGNLGDAGLILTDVTRVAIRIADAIRNGDVNASVVNADLGVCAVGLVVATIRCPAGRRPAMAAEAQY